MKLKQQTRKLKRNRQLRFEPEIVAERGKIVMKYHPCEMNFIVASRI